MFNEWMDLLHYALISQGLSDEKGTIRLVSSEKTMKSLVSAYPFLRTIYKFPIWVECCDEESVGDVVAFHVDGVCRFLKNRIILENQEGLIAIDCPFHAEIEDGIKSGDDVCVFAHRDKEHRLVAEMIVRKQVYEFTRYYAGELERKEAVKSFLSLRSCEQDAVRWMLSSVDNIRSVLLFLAYAECFCVVGQDCSSDENFRKAVDQYNRTVAPEHGCVKLSAWVVYHIFNILGVQGDLVSQKIGDVWASDFLHFLLIIGIVNNISPWSGGGKSVAKVLVELVPSLLVETVSAYLPYICDKTTYYEIMRDVFSQCRYQEYAITNAEDLLFEALTVAPFEELFVGKACDILFEQSIADCQSNSMHRMLSGPNSQAVMDHVFSRFSSSFKRGEVSHHFAAAAIENALAYEKRMDALKDAIAQAMGDHEESVLLGILRVSILVWTMGKEAVGTNQDCISEAFVALLLRLLKEYDARYYTAAASCIHDLIITGVLGEDILNEDLIYNTAVSVLEKVHGRGWAERILSLIPMDTPRDIPDTVVRGELYRRYKNRFENELQAKEHASSPEVTFCVLATTGFWSGREWEMSVQLARVEKYYSVYARYMDDAQMMRLRILKEHCSSIILGK